MFNRGSGAGNEYNRYDNTFYRGVVVDNSDPLKMNRVRIFIPEISNQPNDSWLKEFEEFKIKAAGENNPTDSWKDTKIYQEIINLLPWAEPCYPILGESSNYRFFKDENISTISDCNYPEGFSVIDEEEPSIMNGSFSPSYIFENFETCVGDPFSSPISNMTVKCNPYAFSYRSSNYTNKGKGTFSIPSVGSKVWVFHYQGDLNFPVYFGVQQDLRTLLTINDTDNKLNVSRTYPSNFES